MATISAADIKRLREFTGAGMSDCKKALVETDGDFDKAVDILRLKGAKDVGKRVVRTASNGLVAARVEGSTGVMIELNCETDFVAKGERFQALADEVLARIVAQTPADVPTLLEQPYADDKSVQQLLDEANAALGEKIEVRRFTILGGDSRSVAFYLHKTSPDLPPTVGVLVEMDREDAVVGKDVAQHIAAMAPRFVTRDEVPAETVEAERRIAEQIARDEGKPEAALSRIVDGRVTGFFKDATLVEQAFVKDSKKSVGSLLAEAGVTVRRFARFKVGAA